MCQSPAIPAKGECTVSIHHSGYQFRTSACHGHGPCQLIDYRGKMAKPLRTWHGDGASTATRGHHLPKDIPLQCSLIGHWTLFDMVRVLPSKPEKTFFFFILVLSLTKRILVNRGTPASQASCPPSLLYRSTLPDFSSPFLRCCICPYSPIQYTMSNYVHMT